VERLRGDAAARRHMGDAGRRFVEAHYARTALAKRYLDLLMTYAPRR
jgi:hypothetical protein